MYQKTGVNHKKLTNIPVLIKIRFQKIMDLLLNFLCMILNILVTVN